MQILFNSVFKWSLSITFLKPSLTLYFHWPHLSPSPNPPDHHSPYISRVDSRLRLLQLFHLTREDGTVWEFRNVVSPHPYAVWRPNPPKYICIHIYINFYLSVSFQNICNPSPYQRVITYFYVVILPCVLSRRSKPRCRFTSDQLLLLLLLLLFYCLLQPTCGF
jgi:hypothetical protein